jgi:aminomethyltransferase
LILKKTAFHHYHVERGAKLVEFAGYEMPLLYSSIREEHEIVRTGAGIFDVSHMGRLKFTGRHARRFLERVLTRRISDMAEKTCRYALVCNEQGGTRDDVLIYRFEDHWLMVCNAANREKLLQHFDAVTGEMNVKIEDQTDKTGMVAVQGPRAMEYIGKFSKEIPTLKRFHFAVKNLLILKLIVSRTGYTGENGVEIILPASAVNMALKLLLKEDAQGEQTIRPVGLGARDTLRLEAAMPLYGHELTEEIDPLSADLAFAVDLNKHEDEQWGPIDPFIGQEALAKIAADGPMRKRVGLKLDGRRTPRQDMKVLVDSAEAGFVTSGCLSPTLGHPIAMAYVDAAHAEVGKTVQIDFGKKQAGAEIVELPFYKPGQ